MVSTMKKVFSSVSSLQDKQTTLFRDIKDLVDSEYAQAGNVKNIGRKLEAATRLMNEYQAVASGSVLIFQTAEKIHRLIEAAFTNVLDVGQVSLPSLRRFLTRNFRLSLTQVETQFKFSPVGYEDLGSQGTVKVSLSIGLNSCLPMILNITAGPNFLVYLTR